MPPCLTRETGLPYSKGGPPLFERRTPLTQKADPPHSTACLSPLPLCLLSPPHRHSFLARLFYSLFLAPSAGNGSYSPSPSPLSFALVARFTSRAKGASEFCLLRKGFAPL